jgi:hypothetical protein
VNRRLILIAAIVIFLALIPFLGWPILKQFSSRPKPVSASLFARTKAAVEKNPKLQPDWDRAMEDGVLTWAEAKDILEKAGEKAPPEEEE